METSFNTLEEAHIFRETLSKILTLSMEWYLLSFDTGKADGL